jgi:hypothetical protein
LGVAVEVRVITRSLLSVLLVSVGEVLQGIRRGLTANSVARTGLGLTDDAGRLIIRPARQLVQEADPTLVVPDAYVVVRVGTKVTPAGTKFSRNAGATTTEAAAGVPQATIRQTAARAIRQQGGSIVLKPESTLADGVNWKHANIIEGWVSNHSRTLLL